MTELMTWHDRCDDMPGVLCPNELLITNVTYKESFFSTIQNYEIEKKDNLLTNSYGEH